jgi:hypothetical protein
VLDPEVDVVEGEKTAECDRDRLQLDRGRAGRRRRRGRVVGGHLAPLDVK